MGGGDSVSRASLEKMSTCSTFFGVLMALFFTRLFKSSTDCRCYTAWVEKKNAKTLRNVDYVAYVESFS